MTPLLLVLLTLLPLTSGLRCIACTSDPPAPNWACFGGGNVTSPGNGTIDTNDISSMSVECKPELEADYCFTMVTWSPPFLDTDNSIQNKEEYQDDA